MVWSYIVRRSSPCAASGTQARSIIPAKTSAKTAADAKRSPRRAPCVMNSGAVASEANFVRPPRADAAPRAGALEATSRASSSIAATSASLELVFST